MEVDTPILSATAAADCHIESYCCNGSGWLQTSPEYAMKRLLASGCGPIYQLCHVFRKEESGRHHQPEFTLLEWYRLGIDHLQMMSEVQALLQVVGAPAHPYERMTYADAFRRHAGIDPLRATPQTVRTVLDSAGIEMASTPVASDADDLDFWLELCMSALVAPKLGAHAPCFVYDYPASQAALARVSTDDLPVAQRFELFWRGLELANGFHELNDAAEQRRRFNADLEMRRARGQVQPPIDEALLAALEYGLPDCSGVALGVDRLLMLLLNLPTVAEAQSFDAERA